MDEFDKLLYQGSAQLPPELAGSEPPRPWKTPMKRICWGIALLNVTLNFLGLDVILPLVGAMLLWLGLRPLRRENGGFRFAYGCATAYAVLRLAVMVLLATPFDARMAEWTGMEWSTGAGAIPFHNALRVVALQSALTLTVGGLWQGLKTVFMDAGQRPRTAAAGGLVILEFLLIPLALIGVEGWLLVGPVLLVWILLVWNLWKLSRSLDEAGYSLRPAPVRIPGGVAVGLWLGIPALLLAVLMPGFSRLPVNDTASVYGPGVRDEEVYDNLLDLGFPEDLLARAELDLGCDTLSSLLRGAYGLKVKGYGELSDSAPYSDGIPQGAVLEVPVRDEKYGFRMVYLAYLRWEPEEVGGYMEGIEIVPQWQTVAVHASAPQGKLVWQDGGAVHEAPLTFFFHTVNASTAAWFADFSLPKQADGPVEGWVYWDLAPTSPEKPMFYNYGVSFAHRLTPWQYPYRLPSDVLLSGNGGTGWRTMERPGLGYMAPEGKYTSDY